MIFERELYQHQNLKSLDQCLHSLHQIPQFLDYMTARCLHRLQNIPKQLLETLYFQAIHGEYYYIVWLLVEMRNSNHARMFDPSMNESGALLAAVETGNSDIVVLLMEIRDELGQRLMTRENHHQNAILVAANHGQCDILSYLLRQKENGMHVFNASFADNTASIESAKHGHLECLQLLTEEYGASVIAQDNAALLNAVLFNQSHIVKYLLELRDDFGRRVVNPALPDLMPLKLAVKKGHSAIVSMILKDDRIDLFQLDSHDPNSGHPFSRRPFLDHMDDIFARGLANYMMHEDSNVDYNEYYHITCRSLAHESTRYACEVPSLLSLRLLGIPSGLIHDGAKMLYNNPKKYISPVISSLKRQGKNVQFFLEKGLKEEPSPKKKWMFLRRPSFVGRVSL
jgi:hypothetical protein